MKTFSTSEALTFGWETFKKNLSFFIIFVIVLFLANIFISYFSSFLFESNSSAGFITQIISIVFNILVTLGGIKITLDFVDGKKGDLKDLYQQYPLALKYIGASIIQALAILAGFILFIIPGIYLSVKLGFTGFLVVDKKMGPVDAVKGSYNLTNGNWINLALLNLIFVFITIAGVIALLIGLFIAIPVTMLAYAYVYRKLSSGTGVEPATVTAPEPIAPVVPSTPEASPAMPQGQ